MHARTLWQKIGKKYARIRVRVPLYDIRRRLRARTAVPLHVGTGTYPCCTVYLDLRTRRIARVRACIRRTYVREYVTRARTTVVRTTFQTKFITRGRRRPRGPRPAVRVREPRSSARAYTYVLKFSTSKYELDGTAVPYACMHEPPPPGLQLLN